MKIEEMQNFLSDIQNQSRETKILNAILTTFSEVKALEKALIETQQTVNEMIKTLNEITGQEKETIDKKEK